MPDLETMLSLLTPAGKPEALIVLTVKIGDQANKYVRAMKEMAERASIRARKVM